MLAPRLLRLLEALLETKNFLPVDTLAKTLKASRRTVFRDLESVPKILAPYNLLLESSGRGIRIGGGEGAAREELANYLREEQGLPGNKKERRLSLLIELLSNSGTNQKLSFYASDLGVSESTVGADLDELEPYLEKHNIILIRRHGWGVCAAGEELNIREALSAALFSFESESETGTGSPRSNYSKVFGYPGEEIENAVFQVLEKSANYDWITEESLKMFATYLAVSVERILNNFTLEEEIENAASPGALSCLTARELENAFEISLPDAEKTAIDTHIKACRAKQDYPHLEKDTKNYRDAESLCYKMIERFDPAISPALKTNEALVAGLTRHLLPAISRLEKKIPLPDPLEGEIAEKRPELFKKTKNACKVLEEELNVAVPDDEAALIAAHFYAATLALGEKNIRKRTVRAALVCVSGIGMSYLAASQIRKRFKGELEVHIARWNDISLGKNCDFVISTVPLPHVESPVVLVNTLLSENDYKKIRELLEKTSLVAKDAARAGGGVSEPLVKRIDAAAGFLNRAKNILENFNLFFIAEDSTFESIVRFAAGKFAFSDESRECIIKDLLAREALFSQVIAGINIVLLHIRTKGVREAVFAVIRPENARLFSDPYLLRAQCAVLMLLPPAVVSNENDLTAKLMGSISASLVDTPLFLDAVRSGGKKEILNLLESEFSEILGEYCRQKLKR